MNLIAEGLFYKAVEHIKKKEYYKAIPPLKKSLKILSYKEGWINLGLCYKELKKFSAAKEYFLKANDPKVKYGNGTVEKCSAFALHNLGSIAYIEEKNEVAMEYFLAAYKDSPSRAESAWNYGITGIRRYCDGVPSDLPLFWTYYDARFPMLALEVEHENLIHWDYKSYHKEDNIVVLRDQGLGDTLMFGRYIKFLEPYFNKVYVQSTVNLFDNSYSIGCDVKYYTTISSLGRILDYIPDGEWLKDRYVPKVRDGKLKVACVWNGSKSHPHDYDRSCPPTYFDKLDVDKYTLDPNPKRSGYTHLRGKTWVDTIKNLEQVDLVITVDTSIGHLCGSLGKPCWIMMPLTYSDYRWGTSISETRNAWYSSVEIIRNPGNWDQVFKQVGTMLNESEKTIT